jgi:hypothetical protein
MHIAAIESGRQFSLFLFFSFLFPDLFSGRVDGRPLVTGKNPPLRSRDIVPPLVHCSDRPIGARHFHRGHFSSRGPSISFSFGSETDCVHQSSSRVHLTGRSIVPMLPHDTLTRK